MYGGVIGHSTDPALGNRAQSGGGVLLVGGNFNMSGNASVHGNVATGEIYSTGGGVFVTNGAMFTMDGTASVRDNIASATDSGYGGGVAVSGEPSIFEMKGSAVVRNNQASGVVSGWGGGVYVQDSGAFRLAGGTVYGNVAAAGTAANTAPIGNGAALYVQGGGLTPAIATYGPGGTPFGTAPFGIDDTINQTGIVP
jgi:hypothetical protein